MAYRQLDPGNVELTTVSPICEPVRCTSKETVGTLNTNTTNIDCTNENIVGLFLLLCALPSVSCSKNHFSVEKVIIYNFIDIYLSVFG